MEPRFRSVLGPMLLGFLFAGRAEAHPAFRQDLMPGVERAPPSLDLLQQPPQAAVPQGLSLTGVEPVEEQPFTSGVQRFSKGHPPLRHVAVDAESTKPHPPREEPLPSVPPSVADPVHGLMAQLAQDAVKQQSATAAANTRALAHAQVLPEQLTPPPTDPSTFESLVKYAAEARGASSAHVQAASPAAQMGFRVSARLHVVPEFTPPDVAAFGAALAAAAHLKAMQVQVSAEGGCSGGRSYLKICLGGGSGGTLLHVTADLVEGDDSNQVEALLRGSGGSALGLKLMADPEVEWQDDEDVKDLAEVNHPQVPRSAVMLAAQAAPAAAPATATSTAATAASTAACASAATAFEAAVGTASVAAALLQGGLLVLVVVLDAVELRERREHAVLHLQP